MPVKNASPFLGASIKSILNQTYENLEVWAVDDHSSDDSFEILKKFNSIDSRINLLKNAGKGILSALNTASVKIRGEYVCRMDADDLMIPEKLNWQVDILKKTGYNSICTGLVNYFREDGDVGKGFIAYQNWLNGLCQSQSHFEEIYKECVIASPSWLMHTKDFKSINGFEGLEYPEDYDFVFRLYQHHFKVVSTPEVVLQWRDHPERASRNLAEYRDQTFFPMKVRRFLELDRIDDLQLILYGAGPKGKKLARELIKRGVDFCWVSGNPKKIGLDIYGKRIGHEELVKNNKNCQILVAISSPAMKKEVEENLQHSEGLYYFC